MLGLALDSVMGCATDNKFGVMERAMALISCPECGRQVSTEAPACPRCGYPVSSRVTSIGSTPVSQRTRPDPTRRGQIGGSKQAFLVGPEPLGKNVNQLVKVHDYRGKAIYVYHLLTEEWTKEADSSTRDIDARIAYYRRVSHEIPHDGTIPLDQADKWCAIGIAEANRLGFTVVV